MLAGGLRAFLTCVDPRALSPAFAGRRFDRALIEELPKSVDPCGENGEFHTFAWDGPMFRRPVPVEPGQTVERDGFVFTDLCPRSFGRWPDGRPQDDALVRPGAAKGGSPGSG
jgi:diphthamide synthase (EF-2-diphthine--ammonia ligase)